MDRKQIEAAALELQKRAKKETYKCDFALFAQEQLKILPKDSSKGFQPLVFNEAQKVVHSKIEQQRKETGKVRAIILKARQMGLSTYTTARVFWTAYFHPYHKSVVMAHDTSTSDAMFNMSRNIIDNMHPDFKPAYKKSNAKEIQFEHNDSGYRLYTAGSPEAGRGTTPTVCHLSEVAFWTHDEKILAGLFQGISQADGTEVILESTANGVGNEFHRLWMGAVRGENEYVPIFVPWFLMEEYRRKAPENLDLDVDELEYKEKYGLDNDQMYWRRLKIAEGGDIKFRQEYPATAEEAFIVSGTGVFDSDKLNRYVPEKALDRKDFDYASNSFEKDSRGSLEIFKYPTFDAKYVIGADVALGVGKDNSAAVVMTPEREVVAVFQNNRVDPSDFGDILFYLGRYYNNALLAPEINSMGIATANRLKQMNYVNLYYQTNMANISNEDTLKLGWRTSVATKGAIIGNLKNAIENFHIKIPSNKILHECKMYISDDRGRTNAASGETDDLVIATAIALEVVRTHGHKLVSDKVPWNQRASTFKQDVGNWL